MELLEYIKQHIQLPKNVDRAKELGIGELTVSLDRSLALSFVYNFTFHAEKHGNTRMKLSIPCSYFPACCGIKIIHEINLWPGCYRPNPEAASIPLIKLGFGTFLFQLFMDASVEKANAGNLLHPIGTPGGPGWYIASTTHIQSAGRRIMEKMRWTPIEVYRNPNSRNIITVWKKKLTTKKFDDL